MAENEKNGGIFKVLAFGFRVSYLAVDYGPGSIWHNRLGRLLADSKVATML